MAQEDFQIEEPRESESQMQWGFAEKVLKDANVNLRSGLATDFLNPSNEYLMMAEMVRDGMLTLEDMGTWTPTNYRDHFSQAEFAGSEIVLQVFERLDASFREEFELHVEGLVASILAHQKEPTRLGLLNIASDRDVVARMISPPQETDDLIVDTAHAQGEIDALFD